MRKIKNSNAEIIIWDLHKLLVSRCAIREIFFLAIYPENVKL